AQSQAGRGYPSVARFECTAGTPTPWPESTMNAPTQGQACLGGSATSIRARPCLVRARPPLLVPQLFEGREANRPPGSSASRRVLRRCRRFRGESNEGKSARGARRSRRGAGRGVRCTDLFLRSDRRGPGVLAANLLHPRAGRADRLRLFRLGGVEGPPPPLEARARSRPRKLRRHPPGRHLRSPDTADRFAVGEDLVGPLVAVEREPTRSLP